MGGAIACGAVVVDRLRGLPRRTGLCGMTELGVILNGGEKARLKGLSIVEAEEGTEWSFLAILFPVMSARMPVLVTARAIFGRLAGDPRALKSSLPG